MNQPIPAARVFANRAAAGAELGRALKARSLKPPLTVLGLPRDERADRDGPPEIRGGPSEDRLQIGSEVSGNDDERPS